MPRRRYILYSLLLLICGTIAGCGTAATPAAPTPPAADPGPAIDPSSLTFDGTLSFTHGGVTVTLPRPRGWEVSHTDYGVAIAHTFGTVANQGTLVGPLAYVYVTSLADVTSIDPAASERHARGILAELLGRSGTVRVAEAHSFDWADYDAAYSLLTDPADDTSTLIISVALPEEDALLTGTITLPRAQQAAIRDAAPALFGGLAVNGTVLGPEGLHSLPAPLVFPD